MSGKFILTSEGTGYKSQVLYKADDGKEYELHKILPIKKVTVNCEVNEINKIHMELVGNVLEVVMNHE